VELDGAFADRRVLITGALGFIGSNLARRLASIGARVLLVDSLIPEYGGNLFNIAGIETLVQVNVSDVRDAHSMRYLVQGQDYLFNLAGQTSHMAPTVTWRSIAALSSRFSKPVGNTTLRSKSSSPAPASSTASPIICRLTKGI
jgi:NAD(P)-dependent dehydrogenase (short-subunit alcohol dehydrogenase family)